MRYARSRRSVLAAVLEEQPEYLPLQPGELVTTGTLTVAQPLSVGQCWHAEVPGIALQGLRVEFSW